MSKKLTFSAFFVITSILLIGCSESRRSTPDNYNPYDQRIVMSGAISHQYDGCGTVLCDLNLGICATLSTREPTAQVYPGWPRNLPEGAYVTYEGRLSTYKSGEIDICMGMVDYRLSVTNEVP